MDKRTIKRIEMLTLKQQKIAEQISKLKNNRAIVMREIVAKMNRADISIEALTEYVNGLTKYTNPATGETWSGKGRKPEWLMNALNSGKKLEDFLAK